MQQNEVAKELFLADIVRALRRRKYYIIVPTFLLAGLFSYYAYRQPKVYHSETLIRAEPTATAHDFVAAAGSSHSVHVLNVGEQLQNVREIVYSQPILEKTIRDFKLFSLPGGIASERAFKEMRKRITVRLDGGDEMRHSQPRFVSFYVGFEGPDPAQTVAVADALAAAFISTASDARERRVEEVSGFIEAELLPLRSRLDELTQKIRNYKQSAATALPEQAATNLRLLESLQLQLQSKTEAIADEEARRAAVLQELHQLEASGILDKREVKEEKSEQEKRLDDLRLQLKEYQTRYSAEHPELQRLSQEVAALQKAIPPRTKPKGELSPFYGRYLQLKADLQGTEKRTQSHRNELKQLMDQMQVYRSRIESAPAHESELTRMMRDYTALQTQYQELMEKRQAASLAERFEKMSSKGVVFQVVDPAHLPLAPSSPTPLRIVVLGLLAGIGLGVALGFFVEQMDTSFDGPEDFGQFSKLPVIATIPQIRARDGANQGKAAGKFDPKLATLTAAESIESEQYRVVAMKVLQGLPRRSGIVAVMSSAGGEGKTLTALNLAMALAGAAEGRILVVDGDLRRPRVHLRLGIEVAEGRAFSDVLTQPGSDPRSAIVPWDRIWVLPGAVKQFNPVASLSSAHARRVIEELRAEFQVIVMDTPPILPIADSLILAGMADQLLMVVRSRKTPRELFQRAVDSLDSGAQPGVVLNDVRYEYSRYAYAYKYYRKNYLARS